MVGAHKHCVFGNCNSSNREGRPGYNPELIFFAFPKPCLPIRKNGIKVPEIRKKHIARCHQCKMCFQWVKSCERADDKFNSIACITKDTYICSKHFVQQSITDYQAVLPMSADEVEEIKRYNKKRKLDEIATSSLAKTDVNEVPEENSTKKSCENVEGIKLEPKCEIQDTTIECNRLMEAQQPEILQPASKVDDVLDPPMFVNIVPEVIPPKNSRKNMYLLILEDQSSENVQATQQITKNELTQCNRLIEVQQPNIMNKPKTKSAMTQTTYTWYNTMILKDEITVLKREIKHLRAKLQKATKKDNNLLQKFVEQLMENDKMCKFYTGLAFPKIAMVLSFLSLNKHDLEYANSSGNNTQKRRRSKMLTCSQQFILTLTRLKGGLLQDIAYRFHISKGCISKTFNAVMQAVFHKFNILRPLMFPSREKVQEHLPESYSHLKNIRVIIDCVEISCQSPSHLEHRKKLYSEYKAHTTLKVLIGCTPNGAVSFVSNLFEGFMSNKEIVQKSKLMDLLEEGDLILADRSFTNCDFTASKKIQVNTPSLLGGRDKLTPQDEIEAKILARNRIVVERVIGRLKNFGLFRKHVPVNMKNILSQAVFVCACLLNFPEPIVEFCNS